MRQWLLGIGLLAALLIAVPASACETCYRYFDDQSFEWCLDCVAAHCGYFDCVVVQDPHYGFNYCDSAWDVEGGDECFTDRGASNGCGPDQQGRLKKEPSSPSGWQLVRAEKIEPARRARRTSRSRG